MANTALQKGEKEETSRFEELGRAEVSPEVENPLKRPKLHFLSFSVTGSSPVFGLTTWVRTQINTWILRKVRIRVRIQ
jgi:hypothetical protein